MTSDPAVKESLSIEGIMVASHPGQIRLLVDHLVIDLQETDVVAISELPSPLGLDEKIAQPVRLELRRGARLLGVGSAEVYEDYLWTRGRLFAMRTRQEEPPWQVSASYSQLERKFFTGYGIVLAGDLETAP